MIAGGGGRDILFGHTGADTSVFWSRGDSGVGALRDVIGDFTPNVDHIDLSIIDANTRLSGDQSFDFLSNNGEAFTGSAEDSFIGCSETASPWSKEI